MADCCELSTFSEKTHTNDQDDGPKPSGFLATGDFPGPGVVTVRFLTSKSITLFSQARLSVEKITSLGLKVKTHFKVFALSWRLSPWSSIVSQSLNDSS